MIRIAICDDEEIFVKKIHDEVEKTLKENNAEFELYDFTDGRKLIQDYYEKQFDLVMLDIDMPEMDGFELSIKLKNINSDLAIIFITSYENLVFESFKYKPLAFLPKEDLLHYIPEYITIFLFELKKKNFLYKYINHKGIHSSIPICEIVYFFVINHDIQILDSKQNILFLKSQKMSLKNIGSELYDYGFIFVSRSILLNYRYIENMDENYIYLTNGQKLKISRRKYQEVFDRFMKLKGREIL